jgi:hypothetical protein
VDILDGLVLVDIPVLVGFQVIPVFRDGPVWVSPVGLVFPALVVHRDQLDYLVGQDIAVIQARAECPGFPVKVVIRGILENQAGPVGVVSLASVDILVSVVGLEFLVIRDGQECLDRLGQTELQDIQVIVVGLENLVILVLLVTLVGPASQVIQVIVECQDGRV